jgi:hypothetical protein
MQETDLGPEAVENPADPSLKTERRASFRGVQILADLSEIVRLLLREGLVGHGACLLWGRRQRDDESAEQG